MQNGRREYAPCLHLATKQAASFTERNAGSSMRYPGCPAGRPPCRNRSAKHRQDNNAPHRNVTHCVALPTHLHSRSIPCILGCSPRIAHTFPCTPFPQRASWTMRPADAERFFGDFAPRERQPASPRPEAGSGSTPVCSATWGQLVCAAGLMRPTRAHGTRIMAIASIRLSPRIAHEPNFDRQPEGGERGSVSG